MMPNYNMQNKIRHKQMMEPSLQYHFCFWVYIIKNPYLLDIASKTEQQYYPNLKMFIFTITEKHKIRLRKKYPP